MNNGPNMHDDEFDPFAEPRTIPSGWNGAALSSPRPGTPEEDTDWRSEKFEEPRTIPGKWNVENLR
jgi:hypothetical protein